MLWYLSWFSTCSNGSDNFQKITEKSPVIVEESACFFYIIDSHLLPLQSFQEQMLDSSANINDTVIPLASAARGEAEKLGHQVTAMANLFPSLAGAAIGAASKTSSSQMQVGLLEQTKTLTGQSKSCDGHVIFSGSHVVLLRPRMC